MGEFSVISLSLFFKERATLKTEIGSIGFIKDWQLNHCYVANYKSSIFLKYEI